MTEYDERLADLEARVARMEAHLALSARVVAPLVQEPLPEEAEDESEGARRRREVTELVEPRQGMEERKRQDRAAVKAAQERLGRG